MTHIDEQFRQVTEQLIRNSQQSQAVERDRVFQPANLGNRALVEQIISHLVLPGSRMEGYENLRRLYRLAREGKSCIILMEHYSNFDLPCFFHLAERYEEGKAVTDSIVAMAGSKLNEESRFVLAFTEAYTRIVIYPARMLTALEGTPEYEEARARSRDINRSALREMIRLKYTGHIVLLFPAGTRYRPGKPETRQALLETDSYIKGFEYLVTVGIAGNTLRVDSSGNMEKDQPATDVMVYSVGPVTSTAEFRRAARASTPEGGDDAKRAVTRAVENEFDLRHKEAEAVREPIVKALRDKGIDPVQFDFSGF
ncbi:MAG: 1-acyl-sn-glycerol-3-phosphate acyltransferase [Spirochaetaceae bacterium]|nr:MAG: 1-acyl-sn-glycerol-3-phosphate acyltransferase [Spirochaetaceae bacterium]